MNPNKKIQKTVYIVDDDEEDRLFLKEALLTVTDTIRIIEIFGGEELLEIIKHTKPKYYPALIVIDLNMPRMNGLETILSFKSFPPYRQIPVVMLSTSSDMNYVRSAYELGINAFISKPVNFDNYIKIATALSDCFLYHRHSLPRLSIHNKNKTVLIIENNTEHKVLLDFTLKTIPGIHIYHTHDEVSTLNFLIFNWNHLSPLPSLIILDLYLPSRDIGLNLLNLIKKFFQSRNEAPVPTIIFSHSDHEDDIKASFNHFANAYVIKPKDCMEVNSCLLGICHFWWDTVVLPKSI